MHKNYAFLLAVAAFAGAVFSGCSPRDAAVLPRTIQRLNQEKNGIPAEAGAVVERQGERLSSCRSMNWKAIEIPAAFDCLLASGQMRAFAFLGNQQCFDVGTRAEVRGAREPSELSRGEVVIRRIEIKKRDALTQSDARLIGFNSVEELEAQVLSSQQDRSGKNLVTLVHFAEARMKNTTTCTPPTEGSQNENP